MTNVTQPTNSPVGAIEWVFITGDGVENMSGAMQYKADMLLDGDIAKDYAALIDAFWDENKPKGIKKPKSLGTYAHKVKVLDKDGEPTLDEDGDPITEETGKTIFAFHTGTTYKDGGFKDVTIFNAKGKEVSLGSHTVNEDGKRVYSGKKIGNGSIGRIQGAMGIYTVISPQKKIIDAGVTLYLNAIQLAKFVEYKGGANFDALAPEYGDFDGVDNSMDALEEVNNTAKTTNTDKVEI